jgi:hypothetical protein
MEELSIGEVARRTGVPIANLNPQRALRPRERMNSPLEGKVHLRGLGGRTVCGVPCAGASATRLPIRSA